MPKEQKGTVIEVRQLYKDLGGRPVLRGVNLSVRRGEIFVVLGRSGGGKTVLLKHLVGLLRPDRGEIFIDGVEITRLPERALDRVRLKIGMLFQEGALFDSMTVFENVAFPLREHTSLGLREIRRRVRECLEKVGLGSPPIERLYPEALSGGMKKRVALARALALEPEIVLYDEPTSGVDPAMGREINELIQKLARELRVTSVVVTHDLESAFQIADRVALLEGGVIAAEGLPQEFKGLENEAVRAFLRREAQNEPRSR